MIINYECRYCGNKGKIETKNTTDNFGRDIDEIYALCDECKSNYLTLDKIRTIELGDFVVMESDSTVDHNDLIVYQLVDSNDYCGHDGPIIFDLHCIGCGMNLPILTESYNDFTSDLYNEFGVLEILKYEDFKTRKKIVDYLTTLYDQDVKLTCELGSSYKLWNRG